MEQILVKSDFLEHVAFMFICGPLVALLGSAVGSSLCLFMASVRGWLQYLVRAFILFLIAFTCLYICLEWSELSFDVVAMWVLFIAPVIAIYCYTMELARSHQSIEDM